MEEKEITLQDAVKNFARDLAKKVDSFISDIAELEVSTYTISADGEETRRAYTSISFDGDLTIKVPLEFSGDIDETLRDLHLAMVRQAMYNRATMIKHMSDAAVSALKALGLASE
jgi:hypothetical protein